MKLIKKGRRYTSIPVFLLKGCHELKHVVLNEGLQKIKKGAFYECLSLESIKSLSIVSEIGNRAFEKCSHLKDAMLNEGLQKVGKKAFSECSSLESVKFSSTISDVGEGAFHKCGLLKDVVLN